MDRFRPLCHLLSVGWVLLYLLCAQTPLFAAQYTPALTRTEGGPWQLKRSEDGIQVYLREVEGSRYKAVRAVTRLQIRLESVVALLRDLKACPQWADLCVESRAQEVLSDTELVVYTHNGLPWPVTDRDLVARVVWSKNPRTGVVTMDSKAVDGIMKHHKGRIRLTKAHTRWTITPLEHGWVEIVMQAHIDPAGPLPAWVSNLLLTKSPYNTLRGLSKAVLSPRYAKAHFEFIDAAHEAETSPSQ